MDVRRREFITLLGGAVIGWPLSVGAQQGERVRRIGVIMSLAADDRETQARHAAFLVAGPLLQATRTVPIVFVQVADPVGAGFVGSLSRQAATLPGFPCSNTA
jgi:putative ABC transport system substrate-binding protein